MILMNDFKRAPGELRQAEEVAMHRVVDSGWSILGTEVLAFEQEWAAAVSAGYAVGVGNGLDALEIGLRALGIGPGDEVITTPMTAFATILAILRCGATPVLADIHPGTALLDLMSVERCLSKATVAVMPVHLYGQVRDLDIWSNWCRERNLHLIEDCAQAHLAAWQGRPAGSWGAFAGWSFYPTKNLGAIGDAGALTTSDPNLAKTAASLRNYGQSERYYHPLIGMNSRLDELQAAILSVRLTRLRAWTERRQDIAGTYLREIRNPEVFTMDAPVRRESHVYHLFVVNCARRDTLAAHLKDMGVQSLIHYPIPTHFQESCLEIRRDPSGLSCAEAHASTCLSLPINPFLTDDEVASVVSAVNSFGTGSNR